MSETHKCRHDPCVGAFERFLWPPFGRETHQCVCPQNLSTHHLGTPGMEVEDMLKSVGPFKDTVYATGKDEL